MYVIVPSSMAAGKGKWKACEKVAVPYIYYGNYSVNTEQTSVVLIRESRLASVTVVINIYVIITSNRVLRMQKLKFPLLRTKRCERFSQ